MAAAMLPPEQRPSMRAGYAKLVGEPYNEMARYYLSVTGPDDPRYDDLLIGFVAGSQPDFELLWAALFNRNEQEYGRDYGIFLDVLLEGLSDGYHRQEVLVTGHIRCKGGYAVVADRQLRLASGPHALPRRSARCLLFDVARPVRGVNELVEGKLVRCI
jgi:hypothetical protein